VDDQRTKVTTRPVANSKPEEAILAYTVIWSPSFPKVVFEKGGIEMPVPKGNAVAGSFALRGDGTWNKIN
jgi:hypothetical protein